MARMLLQARSDLSAAKKRVKESEERVDVKLPEFVKKKYWCAPLTPATSSAAASAPIYSPRVSCLHNLSSVRAQAVGGFSAGPCFLADYQLVAGELSRVLLPGLGVTWLHCWSHRWGEVSHGCPSKCCRTEAREELRRQVGTLRFDLSSLAAGLDKPKRKEAARLQKDFFQKVRCLPTQECCLVLHSRRLGWVIAR